MDWQAIIPLLTGSAGGIVGAYLMAFFFRKDKDKSDISREKLMQLLIDAQNARIVALEEGQKSWEQRYNILLQHVLTKP